MNGFETSVQRLLQKSLFLELDFLAFALAFAEPVAACAGGGVVAAAGLTVAALVVLVVAVLAELPVAVVPVVAAGVVVVVVAPVVNGAAVDAAVVCPVVVAAVDDEPVVLDEVVPFSRLSRLSMGVAGVVVCDEVVVTRHGPASQLPTGVSLRDHHDRRQTTPAAATEVRRQNRAQRATIDAVLASSCGAAEGRT